MMSNDYKSLVGLWKKLSNDEQKKFVKQYVDASLISNGLVYCGFSKGRNKNEDSLESLKREIDKAINQRELPAIDFGK